MSQSSSLAVYSRDSVWGALDFQRQVISQVRGGWRPQIAQHRGSQKPLQEPPVTLEVFSKTLTNFNGSLLALNRIRSWIPLLMGKRQTRTDSTSSSSSSTSDAAPVAEQQPPKGSADQKRPPGNKCHPGSWAVQMRGACHDCCNGTSALASTKR